METATGQSVDLHNKTVNIDEMRATGWDPTASDSTYTETENNQPTRDPAVMLVALCQLAERSPRACIVLLLSAVGRKSNRQIAAIMKTKRSKVEYTRVWLRKNAQHVAECCTRK